MPRLDSLRRVAAATLTPEEMLLLSQFLTDLAERRDDEEASRREVLANAWENFLIDKLPAGLPQAREVFAQYLAELEFDETIKSEATRNLLIELIGEL